jgi:type IV secretory pathway VirB4 component
MCVLEEKYTYCMKVSRILSHIFNIDKNDIMMHAIDMLFNGDDPNNLSETYLSKCLKGYCQQMIRYHNDKFIDKQNSDDLISLATDESFVVKQFNVERAVIFKDTLQHTSPECMKLANLVIKGSNEMTEEVRKGVKSKNRNLNFFKSVVKKHAMSEFGWTKYKYRRVVNELKQAI